MRSQGRQLLVFAVAVAIVLLIAGIGSAPLWNAPATQLASGSTSSIPTTNAAKSPAALSGQAPPQPYDAAQLDPRVTQATIGSTIGISGYTSRVRPPESVTGRIKRDLMSQHGYNQPLSAYELDHFIPLGVGGSSNLSNLWLEPIAEARLKDRDETLVHTKVTSGEWTLAQGQQYIRDHWTIHYAH